MPPSKLAHLVIVTAFLSACSSAPSTLRIQRMPPAACLTKSQPLPKPQDRSDRAIRVWEFDLIDIAGANSREHDDCVEWHLGDVQ